MLEIQQQTSKQCYNILGSFGLIFLARYCSSLTCLKSQRFLEKSVGENYFHCQMFYFRAGPNFSCSARLVDNVLGSFGSILLARLWTCLKRRCSTKSPRANFANFLRIFSRGSVTLGDFVNKKSNNSQVTLIVQLQRCDKQFMHVRVKLVCYIF